jgi:hypothetical protein
VGDAADNPKGRRTGNDNRVINPAGREANYGVVHFKNIGLRILPVDAKTRAQP